MTRASITSVKITYRCSYYRGQKCPGRLVFFAATMEFDFANRVAHTCTPPAHVMSGHGTTAVVVRSEMRREVDKLAIEGDDSPSQIWEAVSRMFYDRSDGHVYRGMTKAQVKARTRHIRNVHFGIDIHGRVEVPPLSRVKNSTLNFFQFHHVWTVSDSKKEFMTERLIGWAHPSNIHLLRYASVSIFIDGTFRCVPVHFKQCIVVMVLDRGSNLFVPVFFVLATSKTHDAYWNTLQYVSNAVGRPLSPQQVVCDFEAALINAVTDWFNPDSCDDENASEGDQPRTPKVKVTGCYFHFKQACQRKMAKYNIPKPEITIAMTRGVLDQLTTVDPDKIAVQGIAWVKRAIRTKCDDASVSYSTKKWAKFWGYFSRTWLRLFPPTYWNVFGMRRAIVARTNNPLERFNRELNAEFSTPRPSMAKFVKTVEEISRRYVKLREDISRGLALAPKHDTKPDIPPPLELPDLEESDDASEDDEDGASDASSGEESGEDENGGDDASESEDGVYWDTDSEIEV
jgi:hypothetical protein